jgi:tripartite-type tricarboxylate transporter receptor subunit TctC
MMDEQRPVPRDSSRRRDLLLAMAAVLLAPLAARAANFPTRPVHITIPQPPGGAADRLGRLLGDRLQGLWGQPVVLDNKPGGGVVVGTLATVRAPADGYTLGLLGSSLSVNAVQRHDLPYDLKDLQPIARVGYYTMALVAVAGFPADDIKGLIALAKSKPPGYLSFGSNGIGTSAQVSGELLNRMANIEMQHVPYNGAPKMYTDMIGGQIPLGFAVFSSAENFVKEGRFKVLGVTSAKRSDLYPDVPAIAETLPGFEVVNWAGLLAPAGLPAELLQQISGDLLGLLQEKEMARQLADMGIDLAPMGFDEFNAFIRSEIRRFSAVTKPVSNKP